MGLQQIHYWWWQKSLDNPAGHFPILTTLLCCGSLFRLKDFTTNERIWMRTYQHKTLQGQHLLKNDKFSDTWQPVEGEFCKLASLHSNNPLTEPSQRRWTNNTWRCETCQGRSICHFPWCLQGGMDCDGLIAVHSDIPTLHGSSAVSSLWNILSFMVCK